MDILFLGTSSGKAIPREGCGCPQCCSRNPRGQRLRSSILIDGKILVDIGPDIQSQLKIAKLKIENLKAVLITHRHQDHVAGLKEIKIDKKKVFYPCADEILKINGRKIEAFRMPHSKIIPTIGLIIAKKVIYLPDCSQLTGKVRENLAPAKLLILDGSVWESDFGGHQAIKKQLNILKRFKILAKDAKVYFTHNGHTRIPHQELEEKVQALGGPAYHLAYDGLKLKI